MRTPILLLGTAPVAVLVTDDGVDVDAQMRDRLSVDPAREIDRGLGRYGGGIVESVRLRLGARRGGVQRVTTWVSALGRLRKRSVPRYGFERYRERRRGRPAAGTRGRARDSWGQALITGAPRP